MSYFLFSVHCGLADDDARSHLLVAVDNRLLMQDLSDVFRPPRFLYEDDDKGVTVTGISRRSITI